MSNRPDFIIIGAMKCGTSTLHAQLAAQPGIVMSEPKEPNFFSDDEQYARGHDWYASLFASAAAGELAGEASTHYTKLPTYPQTVPRMKEALPEVRLIYVMRDPIQRLVSQYIHEWTMRQIDGDIETALAHHDELVTYSCYGMQTRPYFDAYGRDAVLPVFAERLRLDPQHELERIAAFIGYRGRVLWQTDADAQNVSSERLRQCWWRDLLTDAPGLRQIRQHLVPQWVRDRIKALWQMKQRPDLSPQTVADLKAQLDEDLHLLTPWLGKRITCDTYRDIATQPMPIPTPPGKPATTLAST